jgi:two-component system chemotaxis sensor kinase CheA
VTDEALLAIFRAEVAERLEAISVVLLAAERDGAGSGEIADLFRHVHSIKGSAGMVGLPEVGALAGAMEAALDPARREGALPRDVVPALLRATDAIQAAVAGDPSDLEGATDALERPAAAPVPVPPSVVRAAGPAAGPASVRVPAARLDGLLDTVGETALHRWRLDDLVGPRGVHDEALDDELERGRVLASDLYDTVLALRTLPLDTIVTALARAVRDVARLAGRPARLETRGGQTPLDRALLDGLTEILVHLIRNAVSHGLESPEERTAAGKPLEGRIVISAERRANRVAIACADDGRGVAPEVVAAAGSAERLVDVLTAPGFSTAAEVTELAGRGVGLDAVRRHVESLGGEIAIDSRPGAGMVVTLLLPLTLAVEEVLVFERGAARLSLPLASVQRVIRSESVQRVQGRVTVEVEEEAVRLVDVADVLGGDAPATPDHAPAIVVWVGAERIALACDRLLGDQQAIVRGLGPLLARVPHYLGVALLGDGSLAPLVDPAQLLRTAVDVVARDRAPALAAERRRPTVLVVDDQPTVVELERTILESAGYDVVVAGDGREALAVLDRGDPIDCVVSDIQMPVMDGLEMLDEIRRRPTLGSLPVVVVTSREDEASRSLGAQAGADAWLVKSRFDQQALLETVRRLLAAT